MIRASQEFQFERLREGGRCWYLSDSRRNPCNSSTKVTAWEIWRSVGYQWHPLCCVLHKFFIYSYLSFSP